jgi:hypothetical protein
MSFAKMLPALAVPVVAVAAAIPANADQYDYISMLDNNGVYYSSILDMIDTGKAVCRVVRTSASYDPVDPAIDMLRGVGFSSDTERGLILFSAAENMCPDIFPDIRAHIDRVNQYLAAQGTARTVNSNE